ncbi:CCA tRNA nucleotidyltransferase, mitochondrial [Phytophthora pseudosyringae]|uniref:CCA tRNA nucleotidyltransferase, mitochondrial n=1 Tax=Phytophthora pseudosyringae TaxID=221518 RepID=A0A8T1VL80_9STRA|nr:CCA tRNA nucleotidyltransferase, mitochondrial [Phytophthora pseudosyringae]
MRSLLTRRARLPRRLSRPSFGSSIASNSSFSSSNNGDAPPRTSNRRSPNLSVPLTPAEDSLFSFLEYIQRLYAPETQLRVAGGWVRDKLRGAESEDIDIALDNLKGAKFARLITKFQRVRKLPPSSVGVVKANSDKSKHLEVATVTIEGSTVDLVHLRAEEYTQDTRVPEVRFATPEDDATRRDLTINALFYNLHTRQVEDFTGKGVEDLKEGIIRTPREPVQTFLDDPLRVLRALRFACEFGFTLDPPLESAVLGQREIVGAMRRKVSRERIGIEVRKMLSGKDPARAFEFMRKFDLLELVFNDTAGKMGEGDEYEDVGGDNGFKYPPREWTESVQKRAYHYLNYLQHSRLALAKCEISYVESAAAIFTPLFLSEVPVVIPDGTSSLSPQVQDEFHGVTEQEIVESSLEFLDRREATVAVLNSSEIVEMLKVHVKWPKPAGKRVALIIEAIATYPEAQQELSGSADFGHASVKHRMKRFMWMTQYHSVIAPALSVLTSARSFDSKCAAGMTAEEQETMLKTSLGLAKSYAKGDGDARKDNASPGRRLDGKNVQALLGPGASTDIARALRVLQVWEKVYPSASVEDELAFLDRLAPKLRE